MGAAWTLLFVVGAAGAGLQILRWLRVEPGSAAERLTFGSAVGLGLAAYGVLLLGLLGLLTGRWLAAWVVVVVLLGLPQTVSLVRSAGVEMGRWAATRQGPADWAALGLVIYCLTLAILTLIPALAPPADLDYDSLTYHLAAPQIYLREERIRYLAYDSHTNFPFTMQMLYLLGLAWGGAGPAKLFHWAAGWLTALAVGAWLRRNVAAAPSWAPALGAALWMSIPLAIWEAGTAYVDLGTALFQFTAVAAFTRAVARPDAGSPGVDRRWALAAGILSGLAMGTKYTALIQAAALGLALAVLAFRSRERRNWQPVLLYGLGAVVVASPWYVKNVLWTHNPVYPFLYPLFPHSVHWNMEFHRAYQAEQQSFGRSGGLVAFLRLPWDLAFHARHFFITTQRTLRWDQWAGMGILAAGFGPLFLFARRLDRRVPALLAYVAFSAAVWAALSQQTRYLLPVWAALAAASAAMIAGLPSRWLRGAALALAGSQLAVGLLIAANIALLPWVVVSGAWTPERYLREALPNLYLAAEWSNSHLPRDARIAFLQETRGFYFDRDYLWANPGQNDLIPYDRFKNGDEMVDFLRRRLGVTHILLNLSFTRSSAIQEQNWLRQLIQAVQTGRLVPVFEAPAGEAILRQRGVVILELR